MELITSNIDTSVSSLHDAIRRNDVDEVQLLLANGADVHSVDEKNWTALHTAILMNQPEIVKILISHGSDLEKQTDDQCTPLHLAAMLGNIEIAKILLQNSANINAKGEYGRSPLIAAIKDDKIEMAKFLIENNADLEARTIEQKTPLMACAIKNLLELGHHLIKYKANLESSCEDGAKALHYAIACNQKQFVILLLENGAKIDSRITSRNETALHVAVDHRNLDICKVLVYQGANVNARNKNQFTPLHTAIEGLASICPEKEKLHEKIASLLISNGASIDTPFPRKFAFYDPTTPIIRATLTRKYSILKLMMQYHPNGGQFRHQGKSPLEFTLEKKHMDTAKFIIYFNGIS